MSASMTVQPAQRSQQTPEPWQTSRRDPAILSVTTLDHASDIALLQAASWAQLFGSRLYVLHVVRRGLRAEQLYPQHSRSAAAEYCQLSTRTAVKAWIQRTLGHTLPDEQVLISEGTWVEQIVAAAHQLNASYVVLGAPGEQHADMGPRQCLRLAIPIAQRSQRQVLVARSPALTQRILAATDCTCADFPVLERARALAERVGAKVTYLHNSTSAQSPVPQGGQLGPPLTGLSSGEAIARIISHESDVVEAILHQSQATPTDLIAVGAHAACTAEDLPLLAGDGVASNIVRRATCSVLVVPLGRA